MDIQKLVSIETLAEAIGIPARTLRTMHHARKIPFVRIGHRTVRYQIARVAAALGKFEVKAVS